jgi:hypothetical protein
MTRPHDSPHLTEAERQSLADGSLAGGRAHELQAHLRVCAACASDVGRLRLVSQRYSAPVEPDRPLAELWPAIRARIEHGKVIPLASPHAVARPRRLSLLRGAAVVGLGAAAAVAMVVLRRPARLTVDTGARPRPEPARDSARVLILTADSVRSYQEEARVLLDRLELQRAMIRPEAMASIERDLKVIDEAIAELEAAIQRDPGNPALRQLLASSYRQKVELLKRADNAG